jgi:hypothetical protein
MGYDLHITRRAHWSDTGNDITADEWLALVETDPELQLNKSNGPYFVVWRRPSSKTRYWLMWADGQIYTKNPDDPLIGKMLMISRKLGAKVQGDDGEIYKRPDHHPREARISTFKQFIYRIHSYSSRFFAQPKVSPPPFIVGDRVIDSNNKLGTIKSINRRANHGYGEIKVVTDDGKVWLYAAFAHGLKKDEQK